MLRKARGLLYIAAKRGSTSLHELNYIAAEGSLIKNCRLVDLLHHATASGGSGIVLLKRGDVAAVILIIALVNAEAELDHAVEASSELVGVIESEAGGEEGGLEQEPDEVLDGLVALGLVGLDDELADDGVVGVDLHGLLGDHVHLGGRVAESLGAHDALHVGGPAELAGDEHAGGVDNAVGDDDLLDLVAEGLLDQLAEALGAGLDLLLALLLLLRVVELETLLGHGGQLLAVVLLELLDHVLIDGVHHQEHLEVALAEGLKEGSVLEGLLGLTGDVVDHLLVLLHARDVVLEGGLVLTGLGGVEAEELGELGAVGGVLVDAELEVLRELLVHGLVVLGVLGDLSEHLEALLHDVLADHLQDLVLLERLARDVEGQILRIDDTLDEGKVLGAELLAVVHDEHTAHVQLDVVLLLLLLEHVEGSALGDEEHRAELKLTLHGEVLHGKVVLPIVGDGLVEGGVLLLGHLLRGASPDGLLLVHHLPLMRHLLDLLGLLLLLLRLLIDLLDLGLVTLGLLSLGGLVIVGDLLLGGLLHPQ
mmetsp:Transcript_36274/g.82669  ORF Transcript_36274/g.82669 Transcript_36274/m.82669 type:complete len:537 (-) Transcript_36274:669-2279(-)